MFDLVEFPPVTALDALLGFFALSIGHAIADFPLQGEFLAITKNRRLLLRLKDPARPPEMWIASMAAHCLIHAGMVWWITGSALFAAIELVIHWTLDVLKCEGRTTFNADQLMHLACKACYVTAGYFGLVG